MNLIIRLVQNLRDSTQKYGREVLCLIKDGKINENGILDDCLQFLGEKVIKQNSLQKDQLEIFIDQYHQNQNRKLQLSQKVQQFLSEYSEKIYIEDWESIRLFDLFESFKQFIGGSFLVSQDEDQLMQQFVKEFQKFKSVQNLDKKFYIWEKISHLKGRDLVSQNNSDFLFQQHLSQTKGKLFFRFPPEPNGYLHLGHAKSILANFESARQLGGYCLVRFDDTNPLTENQEYVESILKNLDWMGYNPSEVTYCSDYFDQLYSYAEQLIKQNKAFVCFQQEEELKFFRQAKKASPFREKHSIEQNLRLFREMREGKHEEKTISLRAKIDPSNPNPTLRDPSIYRVRFSKHFRTQNKWCIYPLYDYVHGICDSIQNISYSLCSLEFEIRRDLYYWFLDQLEIYKPVVWEFSRLNVSHNVMSKRKLLKLVQNQIVEGWNDPRLLTLDALKNRGVRPQAIKEFVKAQSISRGQSNSLTDINLLNHFIREDIKNISESSIAILEPVLLKVFKNQDEFEEFWIDRIDIDETNKKENFFGVQIQKEVCLRFFTVIKIHKINLDLNGKTVDVEAQIVQSDENYRKNIKGQLNWLKKNDKNIKATFYTYNNLFDIDLVDDKQYLNQINPNSKVVYQNALIQNKEYSYNQYYQFQRLGFYLLKDLEKLEFMEVVKLNDKKKTKIK